MKTAVEWLVEELTLMFGKSGKINLIDMFGKYKRTKENED
jgi:hypothetical protein